MKGPSPLDAQLNADLAAVLAKHGLNAEDIDYCLQRFGPIIGVRLVAQVLERPLTKRQRQAVHVRLTEGQSLQAVICYLQR